MGDFCSNPLGTNKVFAGMAYFPATGPIGATCRTCFHLYKTKQGPVCRKFAELTTRKPAKCPIIDPGNASCKYYVITGLAS